MRFWQFNDLALYSLYASPALDFGVIHFLLHFSQG
jgi:hypothetical protein